MYYALWKTEIITKVTLNLFSANAINLVKAKILLFGKELMNKQCVAWDRLYLHVNIMHVQR